jgi:hypothetical protein
VDQFRRHGLAGLRDARDGRELDWPFDAAAVRQFLAKLP